MEHFTSMPFDVYLALDAINASPLKMLAQGHPPLAVKAGLTSTPAMQMGTAMHTRMFEPELFDSTYAPCDVTRRKGTKAYDAWLAANPGKTALTATEWDAIQALPRAVQANAVGRTMLASERFEETVTWKEKTLSGREVTCKARFDAHDSAGGHVVYDLKTCADARYDSCVKQIANLRYDMQRYHYAKGYAAAREVPFQDVRFVFVFVQNSPPHLVTPIELDESWMMRAESDWDVALETWSACLETGVYGTGSSGVQVASQPRWFRRDELEVS